MPFWPIYMAMTAGLVLWGWRHDMWQAPALALVGFLLVRIVVWYFPAHFVEPAICTLWLIISAFLLYINHAVPALFFALSALTYPVLLLLGFRVEYMGLMPFVADAFAVVALLTIGGGIYGISHTNMDRSRSLDRGEVGSVRVAESSADNRGDD